MSEKETYRERIALYSRAVNQEKNDKGKTSSLFKKRTECICKGKAHKRYEARDKVGIVTTGKKGWKIITAAKALSAGAKGEKEIMGARILTPDKPKKTDSSEASLLFSTVSTVFFADHWEAAAGRSPVVSVHNPVNVQ